MSANDASASPYRTVPLTGPDRTAASMLIQSFSAIEPFLEHLAALDPDQVDLDFEPVAAAITAQGRVEASRRALVRLLLRRVAGTPRTADADLEAAAAELAEQVRAVPIPAVNGAPPPQMPPLRTDLPAGTLLGTDMPAVAAAEELLREVGLEELDVSAHLLLDAEHELVLEWMPVPVETAHVWLLRSLYSRVEASAATGPPLLDLEREASRWWFARWSAPSRRPTDEERFTREVREQEWSLVERPTLALDAPVMTWFCTTPEFQGVPPRQQRMARALRRSFASVFMVRSAERATSVLEDLVDGREYTIHEHSEPLAYRPGWLALGRLIPFEGNRYLRSPGTLLLLASEETGPDLAEGFALGSDSLGPPIALEAIISTVVCGARVPRDMPPAPSRAEACEWGTDLMDALNEENLREPIPFEAAPAELRRLAKANRETTEVYSYAVDDVVGAWADALSRQCESGSSARRRHRPGKGSRRGGRKKRK